MHWFAAMALGSATMLAGCLDTKTTQCNSTTTCPEDYSCVAATVPCALTVDVDACANKQERDECSSLNTPQGSCSAAGVCLPCTPELLECRYPVWTPMTAPAGGALHALWVAGKDAIYAVGEAGSVLHYDGTAWRRFEIDPAQPLQQLTAIWGSSATNMFVTTGSRLLLHFDGAAWSSVTTVEILYAVWGAAPNDVFAVGRRGLIQHFDGAWNNMTDPVNNPGPGLNGVWGSSATDVFAVSATGTVQHLGTTGGWLPMLSNSSVSLNAVWGSGPTDVFAVGRAATTSRAAVLHYDGATWSELALPQDTAETSELRSVWGSGPNDVYAVGHGGTILHYDGSALTVMLLPSTVVLDGITGLATATRVDVFAVGIDGTIWRYTADR